MINLNSERIQYFDDMSTIFQGGPKSREGKINTNSLLRQNIIYLKPYYF